MRGYHREELEPAVEEYDDYDEYEDDDLEEEGEGEYEEEYEKVEERKPTQGELQYLGFRQKLKEEIRKRRKKESSSARSDTNGKKKLPYDNYKGTFFGPSQPVIAQRVIHESKSLLENQHLTPKILDSLHGSKKSSASNSSGSRPRVSGQPPKVVNQLKSKVEKLKNTRDYSFLLSDDAQIPVPAPAREPPSRNVPIPSSEGRSVQSPSKIQRVSSNTGGRPAHGSSHGERKLVSVNGQMRPKSSSSQLNSSSIESRKQLYRSTNDHDARRPVDPKGRYMRAPVATIQKNALMPGPRNPMPGQPKPNSSRLQSSVPKKPVLEQRKELREPPRANMMPRPAVASPKPQMNRPLKQSSSHPAMQNSRPKKIPRKRPFEDDDDYGNAISEIRKLFKYDPRRFSGRDDDDSDMEANFDDIMREESRSAKIGRKEDEEQARLIAEEEERERRAKLKRLQKRKQGDW